VGKGKRPKAQAKPQTVRAHSNRVHQLSRYGVCSARPQGGPPVERLTGWDVPLGNRATEVRSQRLPVILPFVNSLTLRKPRRRVSFSANAGNWVASPVDGLLAARRLRPQTDTRDLARTRCSRAPVRHRRSREPTPLGSVMPIRPGCPGSEESRTKDPHTKPLRQDPIAWQRESAYRHNPSRTILRGMIGPSKFARQPASCPSTERSAARQTDSSYGGAKVLCLAANARVRTGDRQ
jgi:hypothetical protein